MATQPMGQQQPDDRGSLECLMAAVTPLLESDDALAPGVCLDGVEAIHRLTGLLDAARLTAVSELAARTGEELLARAGVTDPDELSRTARERWRAQVKSIASLEVATLTGMGRGKARQLVAVALAPRAVSTPVREGLEQGMVSWSQVDHFWRMAYDLPHEDAADVAACLFGTTGPTSDIAAERLTPEGDPSDRPWPAKLFVQALQREVARARAQYPEREAEARAALHRRRTAFGIVDDDGTGQVVLTGDAASTTACIDRLHVLAHRARAAGDSRTQAQLRSDIGRALLLHGVLPLPELGSQTAAETAVGSMGGDMGGDDDTDLTRLVTPDDIASLAQVISASPTYQLQVIVPWDALTGQAALGDRARPGVVRMVERGTSFVSSTSVGEMVLSPGTTLHRLLTDPADGRCRERSLARYRPDQAMRSQLVAADVLSRAPDGTLPARDCQLDHVTEYLLGGSTTETNLQSVDTVHHAMKTQKFWDAEIDATRTVTWTSFFDRIYRTREHDYRQYLSTDPPAGCPPVAPDAGEGTDVTSAASGHTGPAGPAGPTGPAGPHLRLSEDDRRHLASLLVYAALTHRQRGARLEAVDDDPGSDVGLVDDTHRAVWVRHTRGSDGRRVDGPHPSTPSPKEFLATPRDAVLRAPHWTEACTDQGKVRPSDDPPPF